MNGATLIYDVTARAQDSWVWVPLILPLLVISAVFLIIYVAQVKVKKKRPPIAVSLGRIFGVGIFTFLLGAPELFTIVHQSRMRAFIVHGKYLSVTGRLASVRFEIFSVGGRPMPLFQESDVFTLLQGNSFEIDCLPPSKKSPKEGQPYQCLAAEIGDALTVDSSGSLGMRGSVPALRVWRNDTDQAQ